MEALLSKTDLEKYVPSWWRLPLTPGKKIKVFLWEKDRTFFNALKTSLNFHLGDSLPSKGLFILHVGICPFRETRMFIPHCGQGWGNPASSWVRDWLSTAPIVLSVKRKWRMQSMVTPWSAMKEAPLGQKPQHFTQFWRNLSGQSSYWEIHQQAMAFIIKPFNTIQVSRIRDIIGKKQKYAQKSLLFLDEIALESSEYMISFYVGISPSFRIFVNII